MHHFLCISSDYEAIHIALCKQETIHTITTIAKHDASQQLLATIGSLLHAQNISLQELAFIAANCGPAPYTTLRIALTTANALHTATGIPLVSIDALYALIKEQAPDKQVPCTIALLNAFNNEVFFGIQQLTSTEIITGYAPIKTCIANIQKTYTDPIRFVGNGVALYQKELQTAFGAQAIIPDPLPTYASMQQMVCQAWQQWHNSNTTQYLSPCYLKKISL